MQTTTFTAYALRSVLLQNLKGFETAGYTLRVQNPQVNGLFLYAKNVDRGQYLGFKA